MRLSPVVLAALLSACGNPVVEQIPTLPLPPGQKAPDPKQPDPKAPVEVYGQFDSLDGAGLASGWAYAVAQPSASLQVAIYDGDDATGTLLGTFTTDVVRLSVNESLKIDGAHGFHFDLPASVREGKAHTIHAYALGPKGKVELDKSPRPFKQPCATAGPLVTRAEDEFEITLQADSGKFVCAECGGDDDGLVDASRDTAAEWETFFVTLQPNGDVSLRSSHGRSWSAEGSGGAQVHANRKAVGPWELFHLEGKLEDGAVVSLLTPDKTHYVSARVLETPPELDATATSVGPWEKFKVHVVTAPVIARKGIVRADGRNFVDDDGAFYPLGGTLFWALRGWKYEPERVKQNLQFLKKHHYDYVRILGEVDWANNGIDPNWPDYQTLLAELIDYAYDTCGLRVELTLVGSVGDPMAIAQKVAPIINAGRQHKILDLEVANESYGRPLSLQQLQAAGAWLRMNTQNLVALSSGEGAGSYVTPSADWRADFVSVYMPAASANLGTIHMDRTFGDLGWRETRQPWDWKDFPFPVSHNEPIGPRSSVAEETDPLRLAMLRAVGLINGVGAFILHNGAGVAGQIDPAHNRPANLWEVPGIDGIMDAVRGIDAFLPKRAADGQHWNNAWAGNPCVADAFWSDGDDHGVNRNYTVATADGWISTESGIKDRVALTIARHSRIEIFDALKGKTSEVEVQAGQTLTLNPDSKDKNGYGAFIVIGHFL